MAFRKRLGIFLCWVCSAIFVGCSVVGFLFYYYGCDLPSEETLLRYTFPATTRIYSSDGELIEEYAVERRVPVSFKKIPSTVYGAFLIAEDKEFYSHSGISVLSLIRAILENTSKKLWQKKPAGGSTITQQIAKNLFVGTTRSITRKIREAIMAFRIETTIDKNKILEIYLNQLYLGKGCYGVAEACNYYFGKPIEEIAPHEAAFLAAIPSAPSIYINMKDSTKLLAKRNSIIHQMYDFGYISKEQLQSAITQPISIKPRKHKLLAPYFSDEIFRMCSAQVSKHEFFRGGYAIKTTMDKNVQHSAEKALEDGLIAFTKSGAWYGTLGNIDNMKLSQSQRLSDINKLLPPTINKIEACVVTSVSGKVICCQTANNEIRKLDGGVYASYKPAKGDIVLCRAIDDGKSYELYQTPKVTGGIVVIDFRTGDVLGLSGGFSFGISAFNCITQAVRQPGSTIKPFVYAAALENGKNEYDTIDDAEVSIQLSDGTRYSPKNYSGKTYGKTYLRDGVIYSRNLTTVNLALKVGMPSISAFLKKAELVKNDIPISAVLGSIETSPIKLASAFSAFFNDGIMVYPRFVSQITQAGKQVKSRFCKRESRRLVTTETAKIMKGILRDVVRFGTASKLLHLEEKYGVELYGKTGTTNDFKDAWFIGCMVDAKTQREYLVCIFVGHQKPKSLGERKSGAVVALPIFENFVCNVFSRLAA
jgi:penicillin-binding protein 1A